MSETEWLHPIIRGDLEWLEREGVVEDGESIIEREYAGMNRTSGVLLVTELRVLFCTASALGKLTSRVSLPLEEITSVEASERRSPILKRGVIRVGSAGNAETSIEQIPGGRERADEIAHAILRQRDELRAG